MENTMPISKFQLALDIITNPRTLFVSPIYPEYQAKYLTNEAIDLIAVLRMLPEEDIQAKHIDILNKFYTTQFEYLPRAICQDFSKYPDSAKIWGQFINQTSPLDKAGYKQLVELLCNELERVLRNVNNVRAKQLPIKNITQRLDNLAINYASTQRAHAFYHGLMNNPQHDKRWIAADSIIAPTIAILTGIFVKSFVPALSLAFVAYGFLAVAGVKLFQLSKAQKYTEDEHAKTQGKVRAEIGPVLKPAAKLEEVKPEVKTKETTKHVQSLHIVSNNTNTVSSNTNTKRADNSNHSNELIEVELEPVTEAISEKKGWTEMKAM